MTTLQDHPLDEPPPERGRDACLQPQAPSAASPSQSEMTGSGTMTAGSEEETSVPSWRLSEVFKKSDWLVVAVLLAIMAVLAAARATHYLFFHTMAELFAIVMSFSIFVLAALSSRYLVNGYLIVLGASYAAVGLVDVFHTLTFRGMNLFAGVSTNYPTQFWLTARFLEALALLCAPLMIDRKPHFAIVSLNFSILAVAACTAVMYQWFPATFVEGSGLTAFKIYGEYVIIVMLVVACVMLYRLKNSFEPRIFFLLLVSLVMAIVTEFCFTRYISFYDFTNELGHYSRFLSSAFAFMAIVLSGVHQPFDLIFRELEQNKRELEQLNARLIDSKGQLARAQAVAKVGSWYLDARTNSLSWSDQTYRMFGVPTSIPQSFDTFASFIHPQDSEAVFAAWNSALQGKPYDIEHRIVVGDKVIWVREVAELTFAPDGTALAGLGTVQDITERKRVEDLLRQSEAFNASVFNSIVESVAVLDAQGTIIAVNEPWRKFAQENGATIHANSFVGQNYLATCAGASGQVYDDEAGAAASGIRSVLDGVMEDFHLEYPCHSPQQRRWFHLEVRPFKGQHRGVIVAHTNITEARQAQEAVRESQERYRLLFEMSADAIMLTAPDGRIFQANPAACSMFQRSQEEICRLGRSCVVDTSDPQLAVSLEERRRTGKFAGENIFMRKDGSKFLGEVSTSIFSDKDGNARTSMIIRDISERKRIEAALRDSEQRMSAVFQASPIGIVISRVTDGKIYEVNDACLRLYHYTREEALGRTVAELSTYVQPQQRVELLKLLSEHGTVDGFLIDFRTHDGSVGILELSGRLIELRGATCLVAMLADVTERQRSQALIHEQAFHDTLTQLPNRRLLTNRLQQAMIAAKRSGCYGALMYLDLDNFKPLNDTHGHEVGDLLLMEVAARLKACVREMDTVARVGGDEFVVMLSELNADLPASTAQAAAVAEKVRNALSSPYQLLLERPGIPDCTVEHRCSASVGVALFVNDEVSQDDILNRADVAMYQAKRAGRNLIRFYAAG